MDRPGAAPFCCTLFLSLIELRSGKVMPMTPLIFFWEGKGGRSGSN